MRIEALRIVKPKTKDKDKGKGGPVGPGCYPPGIEPGLPPSHPIINTNLSTRPSDQKPSKP